MLGAVELRELVCKYLLTEYTIHILPQECPLTTHPTRKKYKTRYPKALFFTRAKTRKTKKNLQNSKKQKPFAGLQIKPRKLLNLNPKIKNEAAPISGRQQQDWSKCKEMEN